MEYRVEAAVRRGDAQLSVQASLAKAGFAVGVKVLPIRTVYTGDAAAYTGSYTLVPKFSEQTLSTKGKLMNSDVTCKEITVSRVSNDAGGKTVWIGEI